MNKTLQFKIEPYSAGGFRLRLTIRRGGIPQSQREEVLPSIEDCHAFVRYYVPHEKVDVWIEES